VAEATDFAVPAVATFAAAGLVGLAFVTAPVWVPVAAAIAVGVGVGLLIEHVHLKDNIFNLTPFLSKPSG
jgi:hypothetical protein